MSRDYDTLYREYQKLSDTNKRLKETCESVFSKGMEFKNAYTNAQEKLKLAEQLNVELVRRHEEDEEKLRKCDEIIRQLKITNHQTNQPSPAIVVHTTEELKALFGRVACNHGAECLYNKAGKCIKCIHSPYGKTNSPLREDIIADKIQFEEIVKRFAVFLQKEPISIKPESRKAISLFASPMDQIIAGGRGRAPIGPPPGFEDLFPPDTNRTTNKYHNVQRKTQPRAEAYLTNSEFDKDFTY